LVNWQFMQAADVSMNKIRRPHATQELLCFDYMGFEHVVKIDKPNLKQGNRS
jgi:hypothetical protein